MKYNIITFIISLYFLLGLGCGKLISKIKEREIRFIDIILWPLVLIVYIFKSDIK